MQTRERFFQAKKKKQMLIKMQSYITALGKEGSLKQRLGQLVKENNPSKEN